MEIVGWAEPSGRQSSSNTNRAIADALRAQKDEWAIVDEKKIVGDPKGEEAKDMRSKASNRASLIKQGRLAPFRPGGTFTAVSRSEVNDAGEDVVRVYAKYLGEEFAKPPKEKKPEESAEVPAEVPATV